MKFFISLLLTGLLAFALGGYFDWWSVAVAAFIVAIVIPQSPWKAWLSGFLGLFLLWGGLSYIIHKNNAGVFTHKIANVLPLNGNAYLLILTTAVVGALVAGFGALSASYLIKSTKKEK